MSLSQFCDLKEELYTAANAEPRLKGIIFLIHAKPRTKSLPGSREHNECPMRSASPPYGNFESFHTADRNLLRERLKPFTSASQTFRSTDPNPFTQSPETRHIPRTHSSTRTRTSTTPTGTRHSPRPLMGTKVNSQSRAIATFLASSVHRCLSADIAQFQIKPVMSSSYSQSAAFATLACYSPSSGVQSP